MQCDILLSIFKIGLQHEVSQILVSTYVFLCHKTFGAAMECVAGSRAEIEPVQVGRQV